MRRTGMTWGRYGDVLYRETNVHGALDFVATDSLTSLRDRDIYFATTPELALGQGNNKGVHLEFDAAGVNGRVDTSKPAASLLSEDGVLELVGQGNEQGVYQKNLRRITLDKSTLLSGRPENRQFKTQ